MAVARERYEERVTLARPAILAAAQVVPPEGTSAIQMDRWVGELVAVAGAIEEAVERYGQVLKEIALTGTVVRVDNPARARGDDGSEGTGRVLNAARVVIKSDQGKANSKYGPDTLWIDLGDQGVNYLAAKAEGLVGSRVSYRRRQEVVLVGGQPVEDEKPGEIQTRSRLFAIDLLEKAG